MARLTRLLIPAALVAAIAAVAHEGVKDAQVKARMDQMSEIAAATKVIGEMAKGARPFDAAAAEAAALTIADHAGRVPVLFEARADDPTSEALPAIWENFDDFAARAEAMGAAAREAAEMIRAEETGAALAKIGASCKSCHELYRE